MTEHQDMNDLTGWRRIPCVVADLVRGGPVQVLSSLTDTDGEFGTPVVYTEWGVDVDQMMAVLRDYRWPGSDRPCEHWVPDPPVVNPCKDCRCALSDHHKLHCENEHCPGGCNGWRCPDHGWVLCGCTYAGGVDPATGCYPVGDDAQRTAAAALEANKARNIARPYTTDDHIEDAVTEWQQENQERPT